MTRSILIETPRLIIRTPQLGDDKPLNDAIHRSLSELQRWQPWANDPRLEVTTKFIEDGINEWGSKQQKNFPLIVVYKENNKIIAASGYNEKSDPSVPYYEIGYWLETSYTGQGLATEVTNALTRYAFQELKAVRVQIQVQEENTKSLNIARRCGYRHEATLKNVRLDAVSNTPVNDYIFVRFDLSGLDNIEIKW